MFDRSLRDNALFVLLLVLVLVLSIAVLVLDRFLQTVSERWISRVNIDTIRFRLMLEEIQSDVEPSGSVYWVRSFLAFTVAPIEEVIVAFHSMKEAKGA